MKKILVMGALAVAIAAVSQQQASAWMNWKFGAGVNAAWQSGGNTWLWGAFRNGQPPGPDCGPYGGGYGSPYGGPGLPYGGPYGGPMGYPGPGYPGVGPTPMPYFGQQPQQPMPSYGYQPPPAPAATPPVLPPQNNSPAVYRPLPVQNGAYYYPANQYR
jgi:hypothetical protein